MYAVVATGGKQVKVEKDMVVEVELLDAKPGDTITFDVIFAAEAGDVRVGTDAAAVRVTGQVVEHFKDDKVVVFKFKKRKGYKRTKGHRQNLSRVLITEVTAEPAKKASKPKAAKPSAEKEAAAEKPARKPAAKKAAPAEQAEALAAEAALPEAEAEAALPPAETEGEKAPVKPKRATKKKTDAEAAE